MSPLLQRNVITYKLLYEGWYKIYTTLKFDKDKQESYHAHVRAEIGPDHVEKSYNWIIKERLNMVIHFIYQIFYHSTDFFVL